MTVAAIVVTHDSSGYIGKCISRLHKQTYPIGKIIIVDSGSTDTRYLDSYNEYSNIKVLLRENIGFSTANNLGYVEVGDFADYVLFLNPDTFLSSDFVEKAINLIDQNPTVGMVSGRLLGYAFCDDKPNELIDSTGIFRSIYGRWYDRGRNSIDSGQYMIEEYVPALCGALLFCRNIALQTLGDEIFDENFFMYKEDIELSIRLRKNGWKLLYSPELKAFHCRGWTNRSEIPFYLKKISSQNEILLYKKHPSPYIIWAYLKFFILMVTRI